MTIVQQRVLPMKLGEARFTLTLQTNGIAHSAMSNLDRADEQEIRNALSSAANQVADVLRRQPRTT